MTKDEPRYKGKTRDEVEAALSSGAYDKHRWGDGAREWMRALDRKEEASRAGRQERRDSESVELAREANQISKWAAFFAGFAVVLAAIALIVSVRK